MTLLCAHYAAFQKVARPEIFLDINKDTNDVSSTKTVPNILLSLIFPKIRQVGFPKTTAMYSMFLKSQKIAQGVLGLGHRLGVPSTPVNYATTICARSVWTGTSIKGLAFAALCIGSIAPMLKVTFKLIAQNLSLICFSTPYSRRRLRTRMTTFLRIKGLCSPRWTLITQP